MTKKASGLLLALFCFTIPIVRAQSSVFISATASVNLAEAGSAIDGNPSTAWVLSPADLQQDQYLLLGLQTPGNVSKIQLETEGISVRALKSMLSVFVTYDPMNPGLPIDYTIEGRHPFILSFVPKYGAHLKLVFKGGLDHDPLTIREVGVAYADDAHGGDVAGAKDKPWMDPHMPIDQRVTSLLSAMTPADKMELLREGWGIPGIPRLGIPALKKVEAIHGFSYGSGATIFPQSIALAATWDKGLVENVAEVIGDETVSAGAVQAWSPDGAVAKRHTGKIPSWCRRSAGPGSKAISREG
jgi:beta-glucosidase